MPFNTLMQFTGSATMRAALAEPGGEVQEGG